MKEPRALVMSQPDDELLLTVLRKATASDFGRWQQIKEMEGDAFRLARTKVRECQLTMKIVEAHYTFDQSRIIVTFGAEGRVDFRPLLRELGTALRAGWNSSKSATGMWQNWQGASGDVAESSAVLLG